MRASDFEFRYRVWIIGLVFWAAFSCYELDHVNAAAALVSALFGSGLDLDSSHGRHVLQAAFGVGTAVVGSGALLRTWAAAYLRSEIIHDSSLRAEALVADGPYRRVRNPLYLGSWLMSVGFGLMASRVGWIVLVLGVFVFQYRLIRREEENLLALQGDGYRAFCAAVPRLLPAPRPRVPSGASRPRWAEALAGESFFWLLTVAALAFAVTLDTKVVLVIVGVAFVFKLLMGLVWERQRRESQSSDEGSDDGSDRV